MKIIEETKLDFKDVCIVPNITSLSSRKEVDLSSRIFLAHSSQAYMMGIPIIAANMSAVSTFEMATALGNLGMYTALHKHYSVDELVDYYRSNPLLFANKLYTPKVFYTLGMHDFDKLTEFCDKLGKAPPLICIDVANGYMTKFHDYVYKVRQTYPDAVIMAGNVVTPDGVRAIFYSGADIIKVGIGSSAVCRTRTVAGVGVPQLSAILDCIAEAKKCGAVICSDGGCNQPGDFSKAFCAGADLVMAGTMFAGHDECGGDIIDGKMEFYGMSSETAMNKHHGGMAKHRASEGIRTMVTYKGPVENTVNVILGGLRSTGTYINAASIKDFNRACTFVKVNRTYNNLFGE